MEPITMAATGSKVLPFLATTISSLLAGGGSMAGAAMQNAAQKAAAQAQMDFQERMSSTAHQREMADLEKAGLNPILTAMGGGGASSPGGAMPQMSDVLGPAVSSALQAKRLGEEIKTMIQHRANLDADTKLKGEQHGLVDVERQKVSNEAREAGHRADIAGAEAQKALNMGRIEASRWGKAMNWIERTRNAIMGSQSPLLWIPGLGRGAAARTTIGGFR